MVESFERRLDARLVASIVAAGSLSFCAVLLFLAGTLLSHSGTGPYWFTISRFSFIEACSVRGAWSLQCRSFTSCACGGPAVSFSHAELL